MEKVLQLPNDSRPCLSAFTHQTVPGQIFVESKMLQDAACTASGIDELNSTKVQMVTEDKRTEILAMDPAPQPRLQGWVCLHRNTKKLRWYKGDLALVVGLMRSNLLNLWLVPCLNFGLDRDDWPHLPSFSTSTEWGQPLGKILCEKKRGQRDFQLPKEWMFFAGIPGPLTKRDY